jgi:hypothetical protein
MGESPATGTPAGRVDGPLGLSAVVEAVIASLVAGRGLRSSTLTNRAARMRRFASFAHAQGVHDLDAVSPGQVATFVGARRASGVKPTQSERESRLSGIRLLYREARKLGMARSEPTLDLRVPHRSPISARPLIDPEVDLGRHHAVRKKDLRPAVCWALAESTARTSEMPHIRVSDLDVEAGTVHLHGCPTTDDRVGRLTPWGAAQLRRRLELITVREGHDPILMGEGRWDDPDEGRAAATMAIVAVLRSARLSAPGVNPRSIPAWAGATALADGAPIDEVARLLGMRSLDQAAEFIGLKWRGEAAK